MNYYNILRIFIAMVYHFKASGESGNAKVRLLPAPRGVGIVGAACIAQRHLLQLAGVQDCFVISNTPPSNSSNPSTGSLVKARPRPYSTLDLNRYSEIFVRIAVKAVNFFHHTHRNHRIFYNYLLHSPHFLEKFTRKPRPGNERVLEIY